MSRLFKNLIMDHRQSFRRLLNEHQYASLGMKFSDFECIESRGNKKHELYMKHQSHLRFQYGLPSMNAML